MLIIHCPSFEWKHQFYIEHVTVDLLVGLYLKIDAGYSLDTQMHTSRRNQFYVLDTLALDTIALY